MPDRPTASDRPPTQRGAVEWLYILFFAGAILVLLLLIVLAFFTTGKLSQHAVRLNELGERVAALEADLDRLSRTSRPPPATQPARPESPPPQPPATRPAERRPPSTSPNAAARPNGREIAAEPSVSEAELRRQLDQVAEFPSDAFPLVRDAAGAADLLRRTEREVGRARWSGQTWERLATLALLLESTDRAEAFFRQAESMRGVTGLYEELAARRAIDGARFTEGIAMARSFGNRPGKQAPSAVLIAAGLLGQENYSEARRTLRSISKPAALSLADRLLLGRLAQRLNETEMLAAVLADPALSSADLPPEQAFHRDFLSAANALVTGNFPEAVAILDFLIDQRPEDYDSLCLRGTALMRAGQPESARQTLEAATRVSAGRPEAWYGLAILNLNQNRVEDGVQLLHNALAASAGYGPAWEALAIQALNAGDHSAAADHLARAIRWDPDRPDPYFLLAIVNAKQSRREQAAEALAQAIHRDRSYAARARETDVLARMFDHTELEGLSVAPASQPAEGG